MEVLRISSFDGQSVWLDTATELFEVGNFLGGGAAGNVYECEHIRTHERFALKILNPLGYKILSPSLLRRCNVILKGKTFNDNEKGGEHLLKKEHLWWVVNGTTKQYLACYYSEKQGSLRELSLNQCIEIWGTDSNNMLDSDDSLDLNHLRGIGNNNIVPNYPPKFIEFLRKRNKIFREIRNMRKISNHRNVIRLEAVLELIQDSKSTLFLVMELANGGELFDRIKIDCGTREETAKIYLKQLLQGVKHCHDQGVCHRDLKPENLLLQDDGANGTILKIADFGFSAYFDQYNETVNGDGRNIPANAFHSPVQQSKEEPLRVLKSIVGSPFYVAPEVMQSSGYDGTKVDVWSLGVILYAMLAGNLPFGQDLSTCKRFKHFCKWVKEQTAKGVKFWDDPNIEYPPWLFPARFSAAAKGLIVAMLHPDPALRITVEEAMSHPLCGLGSGLSSSPNSNADANNANRTPLENKFNALLQQNQQNTSAANDQSVHMEIVPEVPLKSSQTNSHTTDGYDDEAGVFKMEEDEDTAEEKEDRTNNNSPAIDKAKEQSDLGKMLVESETTLTSSGRLSGSLKPLPIAPPSYLSSHPVRDLIVTSPEDADDDDTHSPAAALHGQQGVQTNQLFRQDSTGSEARMIPSFNDRVKRSTRFITSVPADQVLSKIEEILHEVSRHRIETPVGYISKVDLNWEHFRLEVFGQDIQGLPICALQLYQIPTNLTSVACSPNDYIYSPSQSYGSWMMNQQQQQTPQFMVEFIRGQLEIFAFKRFYQWVRMRLSELVKKDYAMSFFDQASSPAFDRFIYQRNQLS